MIPSKETLSKDASKIIPTFRYKENYDSETKESYYEMVEEGKTYYGWEDDTFISFYRPNKD